MTNPSGFGVSVCVARRKRGMSIHDLAAAVDVHWSQIGDLERGVISTLGPDVDTRLRDVLAGPLPRRQPAKGSP